MRLSTTVATLSAAATAGLGYAWLEARAFTLRSFTLPVLPPGSTPLRVLHLSDLHLVPRQRRKAEWLRSLADLEPDLVVSTGDNLASPDAVPAVLRAHGELLDRPGVFVLGSNDYWEPRLKSPARYLLPSGGGKRIHGTRLPTSELVAGFRDAGWLDLTNRRGTLKAGSMKLEFVGVDDPHLNYDRYERVSGAADPSADLTIGVTHAPYRRVLDDMTADGATLLLAGHTHGGQLCLPGVGALVTNCDLPRRQAKGVSRWDAPSLPAAQSRLAAVESRPGAVESPSGAAKGSPGAMESRPGPAQGRPEAVQGPSDREGARRARSAWMHVSAGMGTSPYTAVRFACRPEASLLTLVAPEALAR